MTRQEFTPLLLQPSPPSQHLVAAPAVPAGTVVQKRANIASTVDAKVQDQYSADLPNSLGCDARDRIRNEGVEPVQLYEIRFPHHRGRPNVVPTVAGTSPTEETPLPSPSPCMHTTNTSSQP